MMEVFYIGQCDCRGRVEEDQETKSSARASSWRSDRGRGSLGFDRPDPMKVRSSTRGNFVLGDALCPRLGSVRLSGASCRSTALRTKAANEMPSADALCRARAYVASSIRIWARRIMFPLPVRGQRIISPRRGVAILVLFSSGIGFNRCRGFPKPSISAALSLHHVRPGRPGPARRPRWRAMSS